MTSEQKAPNRPQPSFCGAWLKTAVTCLGGAPWPRPNRCSRAGRSVSRPSRLRPVSVSIMSAGRSDYGTTRGITALLHHRGKIEREWVYIQFTWTRRTIKLVLPSSESVRPKSGHLLIRKVRFWVRNFSYLSILEPVWLIFSVCILSDDHLAQA